MAGVNDPDPRCATWTQSPAVASRRIGDGLDQDVYAEYDMIHYAVASLRCYRTPQYKLIRDFHNEGRDEFYDLQNDPQESRNLIGDSRREIQIAIQDLQRKLTQRINFVRNVAGKDVNAAGSP